MSIATVQSKTTKRSKQNSKSTNRRVYFFYLKVESKVLPELHGPLGGTDFLFISPQPDNSRSYDTTHTGLVYRVFRLFAPQLSPILINRPRNGWHAELALVRK